MDSKQFITYNIDSSTYWYIHSHDLTPISLYRRTDGTRQGPRTKAKKTALHAPDKGASPFSKRHDHSKSPHRMTDRSQSPDPSHATKTVSPPALKTQHEGISLIHTTPISLSISLVVLEYILFVTTNLESHTINRVIMNIISSPHHVGKIVLELNVLTSQHTISSSGSMWKIAPKDVRQKNLFRPPNFSICSIFII